MFARILVLTGVIRNDRFFVEMMMRMTSPTGSVIGKLHRIR